MQLESVAHAAPKIKGLCRVGTWVRPPYNNRFDLNVRGRHALCSVGLRDGSYGKGRAGTPIRPSFPGRPNGGHSLAAQSSVIRTV